MAIESSMAQLVELLHNHINETTRLSGELQKASQTIAQKDAEIEALRATVAERYAQHAAEQGPQLDAAILVPDTDAEATERLKQAPNAIDLAAHQSVRAG